jgi:hypothetical protein
MFFSGYCADAGDTDKPATAATASTAIDLSMTTSDLIKSKK